MKVYEYLSYLKNVCTDLRFDKVIFAKPDLEDERKKASNNTGPFFEMNLTLWFSS